MDCAGLLTHRPPAAKKHPLFNGPAAKAGLGGQVNLVKSLSKTQYKAQCFYRILLRSQLRKLANRR